MKHHVARIAFAIVVAAAAIGCGWNKEVKQPGQSNGASPAIWETIINGSFVVPPRTFKPFEVVVGAFMAHPRLEGTFTASGANNDIEVLILDENQYRNWENRHEFKATYTSGRVTSDKVRIELPPDPGKYFIIFSNRFSIFSNKGIVADLKLHYDRAM